MVLERGTWSDLQGYHSYIILCECISDPIARGLRTYIVQRLNDAGVPTETRCESDVHLPLFTLTGSNVPNVYVGLTQAYPPPQKITEFD